MTQEEQSKREGWFVYCIAKLLMNTAMMVVLWFITYFVFTIADQAAHPTMLRAVYVFVNILMLVSMVYISNEVKKAYRAMKEM